MGATTNVKIWPAIVATIVAAAVLHTTPLRAQDRPRARELGVAPGILPPGPLNAITDVQVLN
jgi:D-aminopeptidase